MGCNKDKQDVYNIKVTSDLTTKAYFDTYTGGGRFEITSNPFEKTISMPKGNSVHMAALYINGVQKPITLSISKDGKLIQTKSGVGSVQIQF